MSLVTITLSMILTRAAGELRPYIKYLNKDDTYLCIVSKGYEGYEEAIEKYFKVIWKSRKAVNNVPEHGWAPRNQVVIFELKPDYDYSPKPVEPEKPKTLTSRVTKWYYTIGAGQTTTGSW